MGVKVTTNFDTYVPNVLAQAEQHVIKRLISRGERYYNRARDDGSYTDVSGELRSSIGYAVVANGQVIHIGGFEQVKQGAKGSADGKALALEVASSYTRNYALIVVAGAKHAERIEALNDEVVLTSAELFAEREIPEILK